MDRDKERIRTALFDALSSQVRMRILDALRSAPMIVSDLAIVIDERPSVASHHLVLLERVGLVARIPQGRFAVYALNKAMVETIVDMTKEWLQ